MLTIVQFPNLDLLSGTQCYGQLGVFSVPSLPRHGHWDVRRRLLPPYHQRAHTRWGYVRNRTGSSDPQSSRLPLPNRPEKHKLGRRHWILVSCQVLLYCSQMLQRTSWKRLSQSEPVRLSSFSDRPEKKTHKLGRGHWVLGSAQVSLNSVQRLQRIYRKCLSRSDAR